MPDAFVIASAPMKRLALVLCLTACGSDGYPAPKPNPPAPPAQNDPAFVQHGLRSWYLVGDGVTPGDDQILAVITAPSDAKFVDAYVGTLPPVRLVDQSDGFGMQVSLTELPPGDY